LTVKYQLQLLKETKMKLQLPIEVANQILGYLGARPYQEVFQLIQAIQEAAKPKDPEPRNDE
jgi:hypothetical protein